MTANRLLPPPPQKPYTGAFCEHLYSLEAAEFADQEVVAANAAVAAGMFLSFDGARRLTALAETVAHFHQVVGRETQAFMDRVVAELQAAPPPTCPNFDVAGFAHRTLATMIRHMQGITARHVRTVAVAPQGPESRLFEVFLEVARADNPLQAMVDVRRRRLEDRRAVELAAAEAESDAVLSGREDPPSGSVAEFALRKTRKLRAINDRYDALQRATWEAPQLPSRTTPEVEAPVEPSPPVATAPEVEPPSPKLLDPPPPRKPRRARSKPRRRKPPPSKASRSSSRMTRSPTAAA